MRSRHLPVVLLALLVACGGAKPAPSASSSPSPAAPAAPAADSPTAAAPATQDLPLWPSIRRGRLPNGLTYYILPHGKPEKRALLWLAVNAGAVQEDEDQRGLAHFVEHMAFNGTARFPGMGVVNYLESIGMDFGAHVNAYTSFDETVYQLEVPTDAPGYLEKGLDVLEDWASAIAFAPEEVTKERGVVLEEWRLGRGAEERVFDRHLKVLLEGSRYAERLPIGKPEVIKGAARETLARYHKDWYRPDLMAVIAVGDVEPIALERAITARFGKLAGPATARPRPAAGLPVTGGTRVSVEADKELGSTLVQVMNILPHRPERTRADFRRIIAESLYGQMINERLASLARRKEAPFAFASVGVDSFAREVDAFSRTAMVKGDRAEDALRALFLEVLRVEKHGFTAAELARAQKNLARFYEQSADGEATQHGSELTAEITRNFFEGEFMVGRRREGELALEVIPTLTLAELNQLARGFGGADNRVVLVQGPDPTALPDRARVLALIAEVERAPIEAWQDKAAVTALVAQPPAPGSITQERALDKVGATEWTLSNGARVVLKPTDFEADQVLLQGSSPGGLGVASAAVFPHARFADEVVQLGGVADLDAETLDKVLAGKAVEAEVSIGDSTESVSASASPKDLEAMFQLVHLRMTAPRKDEDQIAVWRANSSEQLDNMRRMPEAIYGIEAQAALWRGHPSRTVPTSADLAKVDADKALAFYRDRFGDASDFTFVLVGAFDPAKVRPLVETYLASLPAKGRVEKEKDRGARRAPGVVQKTWRLGREPKARVSIAFHAEAPWTRDDDRDLFVLGQVLSIRLREILREDMGGVYGVGASGLWERRPRPRRVFEIEFGCAPEAVEPLTKAALAEVAAIARGGIGADYLEKVKAGFLRGRELQLRTNGFWASWLGSAYRFGDDPALVLDPAPMVARMTSAGVQAAARRFLDKRQYFQAVMLPAEGAPPTGPAPAKPTPAAR